MAEATTAAQAAMAEATSTAQAAMAQATTVAQAGMAQATTAAQSVVADLEVRYADRPEVLVGAAFAGGLLSALILRRLAH